MKTAQNDKKFARANQVLEIAKRMATKIDESRGGYTVRNRIEEFKIHPGYANQECENELVCTGNWNIITEYDLSQSRHVITDLPERLGLIFEKLGFETEWSDCWRECDDCYKIFEVVASSFSWTPQYVYFGHGGICKTCFLSSPESVLAELEVSKENLSIFFDFDPSKHGYEKFYESESKKDAEEYLKSKNIRNYFYQFVQSRDGNSYVCWVTKEEDDDNEDE